MLKAKIQLLQDRERQIRNMKTVLEDTTAKLMTVKMLNKCKEEEIPQKEEKL